MTTSGVLLVGHGTRDAAGTEEFFQLSRCLSDLLSPIPVESALLEFQEPTIAQAWQSLVKCGVDRVHVAPLLLFAAGHAKDDIPSIIRQCQSETPSMVTDQSRPLSRHPELIDLVVQRLSTAVARSSADPDRTAVVMVGRGSHDPCAAADMRVLTEVVRRRVPMAHFETAFYAMATPRVPDVLDKVASSGRFDAVIVHPHLLFSGRLYGAIQKQSTEASSRHPGVRFIVSDYLGPDRRVAKAIAARCGL
ncbi:Sirohydrochlorin cobaltochelatase [Rubripirellula tenax]|uniref:Sirohydrochlorin cobaltochelatase n=1 Tax=Rubripirellula tenax TaxID=2528015 RepID=A0A5C6FGV2_9BACT|nr:sirohydrochlorin chelatase [Rubripirellula tenax]TWU58801.1 Sirohydrochlorin cobaltochelatase [Rubripirellula tenax]